MRWSPLLFVSPLVITAGGCNQHGPVAKHANETANLVAVINQANAVAKAARADDGKPLPAASPNPASDASPAGAPPPAAPGRAAIPAALQGRWGLTPADCTTRLGDAKGLLVIGNNELRFYESRAIPGGNTAAQPNFFSADFHFTGEGQSWVKFETLRRKNDRLVRTESDPMASFTYARCK
jgi:hypothetical protein